MSRLMFTGSDVLFATRLVGGRKFPTKFSKYFYMLGYTVFIKLCDLFVEGFYVVSEHLIDELRPLRLKSAIKVLVDPPLYDEKFVKKAHRSFNILYYRGLGSNQVFKDWVYGYDVMQDVVGNFTHDWFNAKKVENILDVVSSRGINVIEANGDADMSKVYPFIDVMIRPNRHDGYPRMVIECEKNDIPYYWSKENPNVEDIIKFIENNDKSINGLRK